MSAFFLGFFLILVGPSKILGIDEGLTIMIVGLFLSGCFLAPIAIPALPEMLEATEGKFHANESEKAGNYTAGIFNMGLGMGQVVGPLFGASMYDAIGFRNTQDLTCLLCITFASLYFVFADGREAFRWTFLGKETNKNEISPKKVLIGDFQNSN